MSCHPRRLAAVLALSCATAVLPSLVRAGSPDGVVVINEVHYNPVGASEDGEWIELFNQMGIMIDLSGWSFDGIEFTFPKGTFIDPGGYLVVAKQPGPGQLGPFTGNLSNDGELLVLYNQSGRLMDELDFGDGGRWPTAPDGSGATLAKRNPWSAASPPENWAASTQVGGTPGAENFPGENSEPETTTIRLFGFDAPWRYNDDDEDLPAGWAASAHPEGGAWSSGAGLIGFEQGALDEPIRTQLAFPGLNNPFIVTYYFERDFELTGAQTANLQALELTHFIDDGAVFYLNGTEVGRFNMAPGAVGPETLASGSVDNAAAVVLTLPPGAAVTGTNRLSVEVHQQSVGSSDVVFGGQLDAVIEEPPPGEAPELRINELPPAGEAPEFWIELANDTAAPVSTGGLVLSIEGDPGREFVLPGGSINAGATLVVTEAATGLRPAAGELVVLYDATRSLVLDARHVTNRLRGRAAERNGEWLFPAQATPGEPNVFAFHDDVVISEVMFNPPSLPPTPETPPTFETAPLFGFADAWRFNDTDEDLPSGWAATAHPEGGNWSVGPGLIAFETSALDEPIRTQLGLPSLNNPFIITYYFEREFTVTPADLSRLDSLEITHMIDDGAVFYINGVEVGRFNMDPGPVGPETTSSGGVGNAAKESLAVPPSAVQAGTNRISVEVHQQSPGSSDVVFGLKLDARFLVSPGSPGMPFRDSDNQWLEIANRGDAAADLSGWRFDDGIGFDFAPGTMLAPGERAVLVRDAALFASAFPGVGVLGEFSGSLSRSGERLLLEDAWGNPADEVRYFDGGRWPEFADGGGSSLELRDLDADNNVAEAWTASDEGDATGWRTYSYRGVARASLGPDSQWREFVLGLLGEGEVLLDDVSVIEDPDGAARQMLSNTTFSSGAAGWRIIGNHRHSEIVADPDSPGNQVLRLVSTGPTGHMHNHAETTFAGGASVANGREYEISFRARWITGSNQLHTRLYFNRLPRTTIIDRPGDGGTPGAPNSREVDDIGPTFTHFRHAPAVPAPGRSVTVTARPADPDGVTRVTLFYSVNGGAFQSVAMVAAGADGRYEASIPGGSAGAVVQFYAEAEDGAGSVSWFPAAGPESRALYKVDDGLAATNGLHNFRIVVTNEDRDWLHTDINVMSEDRIGATIIDREEDIYYDVALRLKGSERARVYDARVGYNMHFPADHLYRGVHRSLAIDRSEGVGTGQFEILFDIMISNSGGILSRYYDFIQVMAPKDVHTRPAVLQMARYDDVLLDSQFENGSDGTLYEYELIYYPTSADANGNKRPQPDNVIGTSVRDLGDDKETYRWFFLIKNNRDADDFDPLMRYAKVFSTSGGAFEAAVDEAVDIDGWLRGMAYAVLSGAGDNAAAGSQHNGMYYARPEDGRVIFFPHDMDFAFDAGRTIYANPECSRLTQNPIRRRLYLGHLEDIIETTYHNAYMAQWTSHLASLDPRQNWSGHLSYVTSRSNNVLNQIRSQIPPVNFAITTNGGNAVTVDSSPVTLAGDGWVDVRTIRVAGSEVDLPVEWTDANSWQVVVPVPSGTMPVTIEAYDFQGGLIASDTITVTNTGSVEFASPDNLVVSELHYNPPGGDESAEFIELMNISPSSTLDLTGVALVEGVAFTFPAGSELAPGARTLVVRDLAAFEAAYGAGLPVAGTFAGALDNGGETVTLASPVAGVIRSFRYDDEAPWPELADGEGASLVLVRPGANPDHALAGSWRASVAAGGSPGTTDTVALADWKADNGIVDDLEDGDRDGLTALEEYGMGGDPGAPDPGLGLFVSVALDGSIEVVVPRGVGADDVVQVLEVSTDLDAWAADTSEPVSVVRSPDGKRDFIAYRLDPPAAPEGGHPRGFVRLRTSVAGGM